MLERLQALPTLPKLGLVFGGYVAALLGALGIVWIYVIQTSGPVRDASPGMYGWGDMLFFLALFGAFSIVPTAFAFSLARRSSVFWTVCSVAGLLIAATGLVLVVLDAVYSRQPALGPWLVLVLALGVIRIFSSPFVAATFALAALVAPGARFKWLLGAAFVMECATSAYGFFRWFVHMFIR
jgi:hypothetical protein